MAHLAMRDRIPLWEAASPGTHPVPLSVELLGFVAAALTSLCWLPQTWRTLRTRDARAIPLWTQILLACGTVLGLVYGDVYKGQLIDLAVEVGDVLQRHRQMRQVALLAVEQRADAGDGFRDEALGFRLISLGKPPLQTLASVRLIALGQLRPDEALAFPDHGAGADRGLEQMEMLIGHARLVSFQLGMT